MLGNSKAKINEFDIATFAIHDILGFDISVNDTLRVAMLKCLQQFKNDFGGFLLIKRLTSGSDLFEQLSSRAKLHTKVNIF